MVSPPSVVWYLLIPSPCCRFLSFALFLHIPYGLLFFPLPIFSTNPSLSSFASYSMCACLPVWAPESVAEPRDSERGRGRNVRQQSTPVRWPLPWRRTTAKLEHQTRAASYRWSPAPPPPVDGGRPPCVARRSQTVARHTRCCYTYMSVVPEN